MNKQMPPTAILDITEHTSLLMRLDSVTLTYQQSCEIIHQILQTMHGDMTTFLVSVQTLPNIYMLFPYIPEPHIVMQLREVSGIIAMGLFFQLRSENLFEGCEFNYYPVRVEMRTLYLAYSR